MERDGILARPAYDLGRGAARVPDDDPLAPRRRVEKGEVEQRGTHAAREVRHEARAYGRDGALRRLDVVHLELALRVHVEPVQDAVAQIEDERHVDAVLTLRART